MERTAWTDERLDDLSSRMDTGFARVDADIRGLRDEVRAQGAELRDQIVRTDSSVRMEIATVRTELGSEIAALRVTLIRVGGGMMAGLIGVIAAVLVRGV